MRKINVFMWLVEQKAILTKDNMLKRKWQGGLGCYFCSQHENIDHLLFSCLIAKVIWEVVALCFHQSKRHSNYEKF
jgi:hypothetical protein